MLYWAKLRSAQFDHPIILINCFTLVTYSRVRSLETENKTYPHVTSPPAVSFSHRTRKFRTLQKHKTKQNSQKPLFSLSNFWPKWKNMADWGPVVIAVILFVLLTPGLLFQIPARGRVVEFGNMQTSGASILVHTIIFFGLITIFTIAIRLHIYTG